MSKNVAVFIDVANLYYAARGQDVDVDYVALLKHATKGRDLIRAYAYSGLDPENENQRKFLDFLSKNGYKVVHKDIRKFGDGRVKANLDIELVVDLFRLATRMDIAVIVSGDGDFASAIRALQDIGVRCEVISFRPNTSSDLIAVADEFTDIMKIIGIGRKKGEKGLSMPEMPAKEVNPEFGFREASRGVAAAAIAALREGGENPATRSRRGRRAPVEAPAEPILSGVNGENGTAVSSEQEPVAPMTAIEAHVDSADGEPARRRRRRRGGRGRGRGRRGETASDAQPEGAAVSQASEEASGETSGAIGWQEFDDLSQVGLTDLGEPGNEREYSFQEADPQTLAELGLAAREPVAAGTSSHTPDAEAAAEPVSRSRAGGARGRRGAPSRRAAGASAGATTGQSAAAVEGALPAADELPGETIESAAPGAKGATRARPSRRRKVVETAEGPDGEKTTDGRKGSRGTAGRGAARPGQARTPSSRKGTGGRSRAVKASTSAKEAASPQPTSRGGEGAEENAASGEEGIWQRFRSGRRTARKAD